MTFAIKAEVSHPRAETFAFPAQKTMYGGKQIAKGDTIFVFASENEGGPGLIASGVVTSTKAIPKKLALPDKRHASASPSDAARSPNGVSAGANSNVFPTGTMVGPRLS
jgi:hypothetical protein